MKIETSRFGTLEIDDDKIITFPAGIPGFENEKRFVLLPVKEESPLVWMQSVDNGDLAFLAANPAAYGLNYSFEVPDEAASELEIGEEDDLLILVFLSFRHGEAEDGGVKVTANLLGPVLINADKRRGRQVVLDPSKYPVQFDMTPMFRQADKADSEDAGKESSGDRSE